MEEARKFGIKCATSRHAGNNDAVMFDIDDTLLKTDGRPIPEMISLFHICKSLGYQMVIITARPHGPENVEYTREQLTMNGITANILIFSKPENKTQSKQMLGFNFVLSVGDQKTDLGGSEHYIKLPDRVDKNVYTK